MGLVDNNIYQKIATDPTTNKYVLYYYTMDDKGTETIIGMSPGFDTPQQLINYIQDSEGVKYPLPTTRPTIDSHINF